jgi:cytochrome c-type biogenesis protein CcmH/NrfG
MGNMADPAEIPLTDRAAHLAVEHHCAVGSVSHLFLSGGDEYAEGNAGAEGRRVYRASVKAGKREEGVVKTSHLKKIALLFSFFPVLVCCTWGCGETKPATSSQSVPANAAPLLEQARQLKDAARYTEALAALDKAHQADPKNVDVCLMQAELHAMSSHLSDALQSARNAHQAAPDDSRATLALLRYTPPSNRRQTAAAVI